MTPTAAALAEDLATVLFDGDPDPVRTGRVDDALADALEALEALLSDQRDPAVVAAVAELVVHLVVELRHGRHDRTTCRVAAPLVLERLVRGAGSGADVAPVLVLLGALAVVPDRDDGCSTALDPTPDAALPLEVALADSIEDPAARGALLDVLARSTVHVPVLHAGVEGDQLALRLVPMVLREGLVACTFTSPERGEEIVAEAGGHAAPMLAVTGAELVDLWPVGHGLVLNPGSVLGAVLSEREVRSLPTRIR